MERHQAGLQDTLVEVHVERQRLDLTSRPTASPTNPNHCFKAAVALAMLMGLVIVGLVVGFILHGLMSKPACKPSDRTKVDVTCGLQNNGVYDIFTAEKYATYFIYGHVKRLDPTTNLIRLGHRWRNRGVNVQSTTCSCPDVFFAAEVKLFNGSIIYLDFNYNQPDNTECLFHVYEL